MKTSCYLSKNIYTQEILWEKSCLLPRERENILEGLKERHHRWLSYDLSERMLLIKSIGQILDRQRDYIAGMICEEVGRCFRECIAEIEKTIHLIDYYTQIAPQMLKPKFIQTEAQMSQVCYEPLGVILAVMPWNYPIWQVLRFAVPALCGGNACLVKPAPSVGRLTEYFFSQLPSVLPLDCIFLADTDVEWAIQQTQGLAFTGSVEVGKKLASMAGRHLKKSVLELGGSNAFIVLEDADLRAAARDACYSRFRDSGQSCNAAKRIIVERKVAKELEKYLLNEIINLRWGDPRLPETHMGPLHLAGAAQQMQEYVNDALKRGARCVFGGSRLPQAIFYPPTLLTQVARGSRVLTEEVFGPVLPVVVVDSKSEAIKVANETEFGLGATIYSKDIQSALQAAKQLEVGSVYINRHTSSELKMPFGGVKKSGYGRELSEFGLLEWMNIKSYWQR
ncbi:MAG: aldehyde dehydrogenase family protein [Neisseriaceae bacterium]